MVKIDTYFGLQNDLPSISFCMTHTRQFLSKQFHMKVFEKIPSWHVTTLQNYCNLQCFKLNRNALMHFHIALNKDTNRSLEHIHFRLKIDQTQYHKRLHFCLPLRNQFCHHLGAQNWIKFCWKYSQNRSAHLKPFEECQKWCQDVSRRVSERPKRLPRRLKGLPRSSKIGSRKLSRRLFSMTMQSY